MKHRPIHVFELAYKVFVRFRNPDYDPDRAQSYQFVHVPTSVDTQHFIQMQFYAALFRETLIYSCVLSLCMSYPYSSTIQ